MDVISILRQQVAQDHEALRARGLMIEILEEAVGRLRGAGFAPRLDLADSAALVVLRLDTSAWALRQVGLPARVLDREPLPRVDLAALRADPPAPAVKQSLIPRATAPSALSWTPARDARLLSLRGAGRTAKEIAADLGLKSDKAVKDRIYVLKKRGVAVPEAVGRKAAVPAAVKAAAEPKPSVWTPERDAELLALRAEGLQAGEIATRLGICSQHAVQVRISRLRKDGRVEVPRKEPAPSVWTPERDAEMAALLREGLTLAAAAGRMGLTEGALVDRRRRLRALGRDVPPLPKGVTQEKANEARRVWTPELEARLAELYRSGKSDQDIAADLGNGLSVGAVSVRVGIMRKEGRLAAISRRAIRAAEASPKADKPAPAKPAAPVVEQKSEPLAAAPAPQAIVAKPAVKAPDQPPPAPAAAKTAGGITLGVPRTVRIERPHAVMLDGLTEDQKVTAITAHVAALPASKDFDAELDLELCEAVFAGKGGLQLFATDMGIDLRTVQARFETIVAPFCRPGVKALPIDTAKLLLPALRARVAQARGAA
ncbi:hypothetical protein [Pseudotabrizicola algicola]|uniref:Uncharacterized protein n=1 Tax=Pseudotabrizicola algicola TaxID=2709381 RepID=A0A6B3RQ64_9RHOB|nr:hypothetical protein [Pseudotabrizicola algicola]NEX45202.1 hypothetical protein [Pseudotabrizicola algicola]